MIYVRNRIKELLKEYDIEVFGTANSTDMFSILSNNKIDLILIDILLEKEDGFEVIRKLNEKDVKIPIIILSTVSKRSSIAKSIQFGAVDYILKPFDDSVLVKKVLNQVKIN